MKVTAVLLAYLGLVLAVPQAPSAEYGAPDSGYSKGGPGAPGLDGNGGAGGAGSGDNAATGVDDNKSADNETVAETGNDSTTESIIELTTVSEEPANYMFEYQVKDAESGNDFGHKESRMGHVAMGTYYVQLPDGRMQKVEYVADQDGYRPTITYTGEAMFGPGVGGGAGAADSAAGGAAGGAPAGSYGPPPSGGGGGSADGAGGATGGAGGAPAASYGPPSSGGGGGGGGGYRYRR